MAVINRKLLEFLDRLSADKHKKLRLFISSPYFNDSSQSSKLIDLYEYLMRFKTTGQLLLVPKEDVFRNFFPERIFVAGKKCELDSLTSELFSLCKKFLGQLKREEMQEAENLALLEFYRLHGLEERFKQLAKKITEDQNTNSIRNSGYFQMMCKFDLELINFEIINSSFETDVNLNVYNYHLDMAFSLEKLQAYCMLKIQKLAASFEERIDTSLINLILANTNQGNYLFSPISRVYKKLIDLLEGPINQKSLDDLLDLIEIAKSNMSSH